MKKNISFHENNSETSTSFNAEGAGQVADGH